MTIKFSELITKYKNSPKAFELIFFLSRKVSSLNNYYYFREEKIDFSLKQFENVWKKINNSDFPIERILKKTFFSGNEFFVFKKVFIPKWETEEIIPITQALIKKHSLQKINYIDICSGTGAIGISLFLKEKSNIKKATFLDLSKSATKNIAKNLKKFNLEKNVVCDDWFTWLLSNQFELITANFPYVSKKDVYDTSILKHEPYLALFGKNDGWEHYEKMLLFMKENKFWKIIVLECNEYHQKKWEEALKKSDWNFKFYFDLKESFRFVSFVNLSEKFFSE